MTLSAPHVILVDDDDDLRHALVQALELDGMDVQAFENATKALPAVSFQFHGAIVCDVRMPGLTGQEFLKKGDGDRPGNSSDFHHRSWRCHNGSRGHARWRI